MLNVSEQLCAIECALRAKSTSSQNFSTQSHCKYSTNVGQCIRMLLAYLHLFLNSDTSLPYAPVALATCDEVETKTTTNIGCIRRTVHLVVWCREATAPRQPGPVKPNKSTSHPQRKIKLSVFGQRHGNQICFKNTSTISPYRIFFFYFLQNKETSICASQDDWMRIEMEYKQKQIDKVFFVCK